MRQRAGSLNRAWLAVVGVVLLVAGVLGSLATTGLLNAVVGSLGLAAPTTGTPVVGPDHPVAAAVSTATWAAVGVGVVGVVCGLLALAWLLAQVPRTNAAATFRLHDDPTGMTTCDPGVLAAAVEDEIETYPGVHRAVAVLRGTLAAPELTVRVAADDRTDLRQLLVAIHQQAAANLAQALDTPVGHVAVQLDVDRGNRADQKLTA